MLYRKIEKKLMQFKSDKNGRALLLTGARQVGKTYIIRQFGKTYDSFIELNFYNNKELKKFFEGSIDCDDLLRRISTVTKKPLIPGKTLIFFDEVQECPEIVTAIKFLVDDGKYRYILSGSLLGVDLKDIRSVPVGYMNILQLYPLDFEEFLYANGVSEDIIANLRRCFENKTPVDEIINKKITDLFRLYVIVGGMPTVVQAFIDTNNLRIVEQEQKNIILLYKKDIAKYDPEEKLYLENIYDLIPGELNNKNKRFIFKNIEPDFKLSRYNNSFIWLRDAGVALPVFCITEPKNPLMLSMSNKLFKLFLSDVGLLSAMYMNGIQIKILNGEKNINFGSVYENVAAQELKAHGFPLYYFNSKKQGELDFVIEYRGNVLPVEIKSGKDYKKHNALTNVLSNREYGITDAFVMHEGNISVEGKVTYYPIYMLMFLENPGLSEDMIYIPDTKGLTAES